MAQAFVMTTGDDVNVVKLAVIGVLGFIGGALRALGEDIQKHGRIMWIPAIIEALTSGFLGVGVASFMFGYGAKDAMVIGVVCLVSLFGAKWTGETIKKIINQRYGGSDE